jgi:ankyrin repeat protein
LSASAKGDVTQVDQLIQAGDITLASKDIMDRTALHIAASEGHEELVRFLLEQKADPTVKDKFGNTPFNDCVRSKHDKVVSIIKDYDPNITFKLAENEMGVLMCQAAFDGRLEDIQRLVINGVDPNENDYDGRTAM